MLLRVAKCFRVSQKRRLKFAWFFSGNVVFFVQRNKIISIIAYGVDLYQLIIIKKMT